MEYFFGYQDAINATQPVCRHKRLSATTTTMTIEASTAYVLLRGTYLFANLTNDDDNNDDHDTTRR